MFNLVSFFILVCNYVGQAKAGNAEACSQLSAAKSNQVFNQNSGDIYTTLRQHHQSQVAWKSPLCVFVPKSAEELASGFGIITSNDAKVAVRGGGHSYLSAWANIDNGVLIVTSEINDLRYDEKSKTVYAGMGNTWDQLYTYMEKFGRQVVGGRGPTVGLATILGGGLSHLSSKYGFAADNVVSFELVTSNSSLITVTAASNPDLFFALKSGSTNFGIVTHVTLCTYPLGKIWGGPLIYTNDQRDAVMRALHSYQKSGQLDTNSAVLPYLFINNNTIQLTLVYLRETSQRPAAFQPFYDIPMISDLTKTYDKFSDLVRSPVNLVVPRWTLGMTTFLQDEDVYVEVARICQNATSGLSTVQGGTFGLFPQPISRSMITESRKRGENPMAKHLDERPQMWFNIDLGWTFEQDDQRVGDLLMDTLAKIEVLTKARKVYHPFIFANDAFDRQKPYQSYGDDVYARLKKERREIDPSSFFQNNVPGGFKIGL